MATLFSDVFEAIRIIRQKKGASEEDIMTYVHERLGQGVSIRTVLKTMKTLNRLVDEGLLVKCGKRYTLPLPKEQDQNKDSRGGYAKDNEGKNGDNCDDMDEDEDDCEEDEDSENEEDEDEDDDDDDECDDEEEDICNDEENQEKKGKEEEKKKDQCEMDEDNQNRKEEGNAERENGVDMKMKKYMESELNPVADSFMCSRKHRRGNRRNELFDEEFDDMSGNQSPSRKSSDDIELLMDVEEGLHEFEGGAQFIDDLTFGYNDGGIPEGHIDVYKRKSPSGPPPPNTPGVQQIQRKESLRSENAAEEESRTRAKIKQLHEGDKKQNEREKQPSNANHEEGGEVKPRKDKILKRDFSVNITSDIKQASICDLCKKKKPPVA